MSRERICALGSRYALSFRSFERNPADGGGSARRFNPKGVANNSASRGGQPIVRFESAFFPLLIAIRI
jgi:hypothetical protein